MATSPFKTVEERAAERAAKREAVLRAAVRMFNERGFYSTSLDDVAASLGISKRTIYHYLSSKDQVLLETFLRRYAEINMEDFGRCVIRTGEEALSPESMPHYNRLKRGVDTAMRDMIAEAVADGSIPPIDVKIAAFTLAGALNWPARWHQPDGSLSAQQIAAAMTNLLMRGVAPEDPEGGVRA